MKLLLDIIIILLIPITVFSGDDYLDGVTINPTYWNAVLDTVAWDIVELDIIDSIYNGIDVTDNNWYASSFEKKKIDTNLMYIKQIDTTLKLDSIVCDSTFEKTLTDKNGKVYFMNLETDCDRYFSRKVDTTWADKVLIYLKPDEVDYLKSWLKKKVE